MPPTVLSTFHYIASFNSHDRSVRWFLLLSLRYGRGTTVQGDLSDPGWLIPAFSSPGMFSGRKGAIVNALGNTLGSSVD